MNKINSTRYARVIVIFVVRVISIDIGIYYVC